MTVVDEQVVLVSTAGEPIGAWAKATVHTEQTPLHLAFSLYLSNDSGQLLLTRRALGKRTWPGVWTNSCCGHPLPGEAMEDAVRRRLRDELGLEVTALECAVPDFAYRARDASGIWENEVCPVFTGRVHPNQTPVPNPSEVMDWAWVDWQGAASAMTSTPFAFSPWAIEQIKQLSDPLER